MRFHSLYAKFLLGYLIFGLLGFITISTFSSDYQESGERQNAAAR